jgi:uncharacterized membrane protein
MLARKTLWILLAIHAVGVGLYPFVYYLIAMQHKGFLETKPAVHISFGGLALLTGWPQLSTKWRNRYLSLHRRLGRLYLISVGCSSGAGLYLAFHATGGIICSTGFATLAWLWLATAVQAYSSIRKGNIRQHQEWMIVNYSFTFAAVTLRIWLPVLQFHVFHAFLPAYRIVAWLSWVLNGLVALLIIRKRRLAARA